MAEVRTTTTRTLVSVSTKCAKHGGLLAALLAGSVAHAGPLDDFARANGGSDLQIDIAAAVNAICPQLVASFGGLDGALDAPETANKDITLRCNELVLTAVDFGDGTVQPRRTLGYTDPDDLLAALQNVTGEEINSQNTMTVRAANSQFSNVAARLGALRLASTGAGTTGPATAFNFEKSGFSFDSHTPVLGGGASVDDMILKRAGFFINGGYNTGDRDQTTVEDGFDFDAFGVTAGLDYRFDTAVLGFSVGYDDFSSEFSTSAVVAGGEIEADGVSASVFALKEFGYFFVDAIATYGQLDFDSNRLLVYDSNNDDPTCQCPDQNREIVASSEGDHFSASATAGWQWYADAWLIQPSFGISVRNYTIDGFSERDTQADGGMELRFGDQDVDSTRSVLGLQVSRGINRDFGVLRPWFSLEWYHEFEDDPSSFAAKYAQEDELAQSTPGFGFSNSLVNCLSCFRITGEEPDTDFGVAGVGVSFVFPNFMQMLFYYEGLLGYENLTSHAFTLNFRSQF